MCRFNCFDWDTIDHKEKGKKQVIRQTCLLKDDLHGKKDNSFPLHSTSTECPVSCDQMKVYLSDLKAEIERSGFWKLRKFNSPFTDYKLVPSGFKDNPWDYSQKGFTKDDLCPQSGDNYRITVMEVDHYLSLAKKAKPQDLIQASKSQTTQISEQPKENKVVNPLTNSRNTGSTIKNPSETSQHKQHKLSIKPQVEIQVDPIQDNLLSDLNKGLSQSTQQQSNKKDLSQQLLLIEKHPTKSVLADPEESTPKFGSTNSIRDNRDLVPLNEEILDGHTADPLFEESGNPLNEKRASQQLVFSFQDPVKTDGVTLKENIKPPGNTDIGENGSGLNLSSNIGSVLQNEGLSESIPLDKLQEDTMQNKSLRSLSGPSLGEELANSIQFRSDVEHLNSVNRDPLNPFESLSVTETQKKSKSLSKIDSPEKTLQSLNQSPKKLENSLVRDDSRNSMLEESLPRNNSDLKSSLIKSKNLSDLQSRKDLKESLTKSQEDLEGDPFKDLQVSKLITREQLVL